MKPKKVCCWLLAVALILVTLVSVTLPVEAAEVELPVTGNVFEFKEGEKYTFSSAASNGRTNEVSTVGILSIHGNVTDEGPDGDFQKYTVGSGNFSIMYNFDTSILEVDDTAWHIIEDKSKQIDDFSADTTIKSGAVIVQTSQDGKKWLTEAEKCDAFTAEATNEEPLYTTKEVQLQNGTYFRVVVAYELEKKVGEKKLGPVTMDEVETKKVAEVYRFYACNSGDSAERLSAEDTPRKEIAGKPVKTEKDKGFSGELPLDNDDPHFGWTLGTFVVNGYTGEEKDGDTPVFLKNVGDKVVLWFSLSQDIEALNGNSNIIINDDDNGYDQEFGIPKTDFGHGTLIIRYTDFEGHADDPVIYTNFLEANARTGADTRVQLFEEGDYEVTLDYEIKNSPRKVVGISILPTYTNYKITFKFEVRNGNCMIYPFDTQTGVELADNAITEDGFRLDWARSRYLKVNVQKDNLKVGSDGLLSRDTRFNRPAKDNESYEDAGIYTFTVTNQYTGAITEKIIYVGNNRYLLALATNKLSIEALNDMIEEGYSVEDDGSLTAPVIVYEPEIETEESGTTVANSETTDTAAQDTPSSGSADSSGDAAGAASPDNLATPGETAQKSTTTIVIAAGAVAAAFAGGAVVGRRKKGKKGGDE